jgi:hypothetical protein
MEWTPQGRLERLRITNEMDEETLSYRDGDAEDSRLEAYLEIHYDGVSHKLSGQN